MKNSKVFGGLVASAVVGILAAAPAMANDKASAGHFCASGCGGKSECKGHGNAECAGKNSCSGKGWTKAKDEAECGKKGGTWTEEAAADHKEEKAPKKAAKKG